VDEPVLRAWLQEGVPPATFYAERPGRWVAEPEWPSPHTRGRDYWLDKDRLVDTALTEKAIVVHSVQTHGLHVGKWSIWGAPGDWPSDQRGEDALAACFTSAPLEAPLEVLGNPEVSLTLSADRPNALVAVRLCDVAPDGASALVSHGLLNLTHRESHEAPSPVEPGRRYTVTVRLKMIGYRMAAGHRWRVAVAPAYWPRAWPSPEPVTLTLFTGLGSHLTLPVRLPRPEGERRIAFEAPESSAEMAHEVLRPARRERGFRYDLVRGVTELVDTLDEGRVQLLPSGIEREFVVTDTYTIADSDPLSAAVCCERRLGLTRGEWRTQVVTDSRVTADAEAFHLTNTVEAFEGEARIFTRTWTFSVPRDLL
jgi:hypothetical protein